MLVASAPKPFEPQNWSKINAEQPCRGRRCSLPCMPQPASRRSPARAPRSRRFVPRSRRLTARLDRLEQTTAPAGAAAPTAPPAAAPQRSRRPRPRVAAATEPAIRFSGDLRYRHETINEDAEVERHRQRHPCSVRRDGRRRRQRPRRAPARDGRRRSGLGQPNARHGLQSQADRRRPRVLQLGRDGAAHVHGRQDRESVLPAGQSSFDLRQRSESRRSRGALRPRRLVRELRRLVGRGAQRGRRLDHARRPVRLSSYARQRHARYGRCGLLRLPRNAGPHAVLGRRSRRQSRSTRRRLLERLQSHPAVRRAQL